MKNKVFIVFFIFSSCGIIKKHNESTVSENIIVEIIENNEATSEVQLFYYSGGNGTILSHTIENGNEIIIRRHLQRFRVFLGMWFPCEERLIVFEKPSSNSNTLFQLDDGSYVNTLQVANVVNLLDNSISNWVKIKDDIGRTGWLDMNTRLDPYRDGNGAFLETIRTGNKEWTVIKVNDPLAVFASWSTVDIRDKPGLTDSTVIFQWVNENNVRSNVRALAITREVDIVNGRSGHWVRIIDNEERVGWIFHRNHRWRPNTLIPEGRIEFPFRQLR